MERERSTLPTDAASPGTNRVRRSASARRIEALRDIVAMLILVLRVCILGRRPGRLLPSWWIDLPDEPISCAHALAMSLRGSFGAVIVRMCCQRGIGPGHPDWPELSRAIVAFGGSLEMPRRYAEQGCVSRPEWWENHWVSPAVILAPPPAPSLLARLAAAQPPSVPEAAFNVAAPALMPAFRFAARARHVFARAGPGPPIRASVSPTLLAA